MGEGKAGGDPFRWRRWGTRVRMLRLPGNAAIVADVLVDLSDNGTGITRRGVYVEELAARAGCGVSAVEKRIKTLRRAGVIEPHITGRGGTTATYRLVDTGDVGRRLLEAEQEVTKLRDHLRAERRAERLQPGPAYGLESTISPDGREGQPVPLSGLARTDMRASPDERTGLSSPRSARSSAPSSPYDMRKEGLIELSPVLIEAVDLLEEFAKTSHIGPWTFNRRRIEHELEQAIYFGLEQEAAAGAVREVAQWVTWLEPGQTPLDVRRVHVLVRNQLQRVRRLEVDGQGSLL